jgi:nucleoside-diphosphate-sugar epimerase
MLDEENEHNICLVTGGTGFLGLHVIYVLVNDGFKVRTTVRDITNEKKLLPIKNIEKSSKFPIEIVNADLLNSSCWKNAVKNVKIIMHTASPFPNDMPKDEQELIKPALEGTLNILNAAFEEGCVEKIVLTSSVVTVSGQSRDDRIFNEDDCPEFDQLSAYAKSKYLSEKAAFDFVENKKKQNLKCFDLAVINPTFIIGPSLHLDVASVGTSERRILEVLTGRAKKIRCWYVAVCDVRDVALAHLRAAVRPEASGKRHIIASNKKFSSMKEFADILREEFEQRGYDIAKEEEPGPTNNTRVDNTRMIEVLGITPIALKNTLIDMANSFIEAGIAENY